MKKRPNVLTIAGFDPSSGAGLTADIKTFEALKCYGLAVCSANTIQNDTDFDQCIWIDKEVMKSQISILFKKMKIDFVKIGIVQNWEVLNEIIDFLLQKNNQIKIILDPVLRSSSSFDFHSSIKNDNRSFEEVLKKIYLITPNYEEIERLYKDKNIEETINHISGYTNLFLKGGHRKEMIGKDELYTMEGRYFTLNPKANNITEKHGSGCVLSSAITAYVALGFPLLKACFRGKKYTEKVLNSNRTLLGYHRF
ncbi:hydroxymethylpyrimidine/phosphomethylpyrimidine kinase [Aquimarina litoralis]|uniref:hydroxymethylpyrimidine/phosphomethylpyrimidine kinase n=1 Tax=Aquimarina litoralis TaxID=584605 RepID=UPI001C5911E2|nr:hydroxymethylpyrimidine/phosphomethylpyrimidine kinase [Aquimarina litoralis]MBW1295260.1 hydroxymethylpyrimidine/phosphomethylpyrimidine kinase [Aquimarina litoralis]